MLPVLAPSPDCDHKGYRKERRRPFPGIPGYYNVYRCPTCKAWSTDMVMHVEPQSNPVYGPPPTP